MDKQSIQYKYIQRLPNGEESTYVTTEHMLYPSEIQQMLHYMFRINMTISDVQNKLDFITLRKTEYYYITRRGKYIRCYPLAEWKQLVEM